MTKTGYAQLLKTMRDAGVTEIKMTEDGLAKIGAAFADTYSASSYTPEPGEVGRMLGIKFFKAD